MRELNGYAKKNPGKLLYASIGNGSTPHLAGELFKATTGTQIVHVPYKSGPQATADLIGGQPLTLRAAAAPPGAVAR